MEVRDGNAWRKRGTWVARGPSVITSMRDNRVYKDTASGDFCVENDDDDFLPPRACLRGSFSVYNIERLRVVMWLCWIMVLLIFAFTLDGVAGFSGGCSVARGPLSSSSVKLLTYKYCFSTRKKRTNPSRDNMKTLTVILSSINNLVDAAFDAFETLPTSSGKKEEMKGGNDDSKQLLAEIQHPSTVVLNASEGSLPPFPALDPFLLVEGDIVVKPFHDIIAELMDTEHPMLTSVAKCLLLERRGKRFRPTVVALMSRALESVKNLDCNEPIFKNQAALGAVTEIIHVASLLHDDVLDEAETRRGGPAIHKTYGSKVAVLAGDYLLARASLLLARLNDIRIVQIMSGALNSMVQGETMQVKSAPEDLLNMEFYLRTSYYKTGSLICAACTSTALLSGHAMDDLFTRKAKEYGYHIGLAFQVVDDILDLTGSSDILGKPAMADMRLGLATALLLYAQEDLPSLRPIIKRRFKNLGDIEEALRMIQRCGLTLQQIGPGNLTLTTTTRDV